MRVNKADRGEFLELLIASTQLIQQWGKGNDQEIQMWVEEIAASLCRRDERLRKEEKKEAA